MAQTANEMAGDAKTSAESALQIAGNSLRYDTAQGLTHAQRAQARRNISAMADTPSGDPMHFMYEAAGAVYDADSGTWSYALTASGREFAIAGVATSEVMTAYMDTYAQCRSLSLDNICNGSRASFVFATTEQRGGFGNASDCNIFGSFANSPNLVLAVFPKYYIKSFDYAFYNCPSLKYVAFRQSSSSLYTARQAFANCRNLERVYIHGLCAALDLSASDALETDSAAFLISNASTVPNITITLSAAVYARAMSDASVQSALEAKPNVTLASAGSAN